MYMIIVIPLVIVLAVLCIWVATVIYSGVRYLKINEHEIAEKLINKTPSEAKEFLKNNHVVEVVYSANHINFTFSKSRLNFVGVVNLANNICIQTIIVVTGMVPVNFSELKPHNFDEAYQQVIRQGYNECYVFKPNTENKTHADEKITKFIGINNDGYYTIEAINSSLT